MSSLTYDLALEKIVRSLLPFDDASFRAALGAGDEILLAAAAGSFAAVVRSSPAVLRSQVSRLDFCVAVSHAAFFEGNVPVWMIEAAIQGAEGSADAIDGIPSDLLVEIQVIGLQEISRRSEDGFDLVGLRESALVIADGVRRGLPS